MLIKKLFKKSIKSLKAQKKVVFHSEDILQKKFYPYQQVNLEQIHSIQLNMFSQQSKLSKSRKKDQIFYLQAGKQQKSFLDRQKIVALSFIQNGRNYTLFAEMAKKSHLNVTVERNSYPALIALVISQAFRKLEKFLSKISPGHFSPVNKLDMKLVYSIVQNLRKNQELKQIFNKFIKLKFRIDNIHVSFSQCTKLYTHISSQISLKKQLMPRNYQTEKSISVNDSSAWNIQNQKFLMEQYIKGRSIEGTKSKMIERYGQKIAMIDQKLVTTKIKGIIEKTFHKLKNYIKFHPQRIPALRLDKQLIQDIYNMELDLQQRVNILKFSQNQINLNSILQLIQELNNYGNKRQNESQKRYQTQ